VPSLLPYDPLLFKRSCASLPPAARFRTVNHVASAFGLGFADPRKHGDGASSRFLQRQYKCYRNLNADVKRQKQSLASILVNMFGHAQTAGRQQPEAFRGDFLLRSCRSCEY
jgi:hypothetical protein